MILIDSMGMLFKAHPTAYSKLPSEFTFNFLTIFKSIIDRKPIFLASSKHEWVVVMSNDKI